ncbi:MAG: 3-oxoacyl-ACP reductase FabG [Thermomicrobiales bacterium]|nr:3-oxoacyl-ACP reductase FabG [Thermomicrobiales bacterium]
MSDLSGKVALVTGASRGIGAGIAEALAAHGAAVAVNYATGQQEADAVVAKIVAAGGRAIPVQADVSNAEDVDRMVAQVAEALGPISIVVNNAGLTDTHVPWQQITEEDWDRVLDVNLKSCYLTLRATYPFMKEAGWGRIINISSVTFHLGMKNLLHYVSSKGGMIGFTRTLARDVGVDGITVNAITPGAIHVESELHVHPDQDALRARLNEQQSIKRRGLPADIAAAVVFFASPDASFITGQTLNVDGGWAMY